jgi:hypothetical protein
VEKKRWLKPILMILLRGKPQEMVLVPCKGGGEIAAAHDSHAACINNDFGLCNNECAGISGS